MSNQRSKWYLLSLILAVSIFLAAFGIALAATVQVSQQVPSSVDVISVTVLSDEDLKLFHDEAGTNPVTSLEFEVLNLQPPLESRSNFYDIYIRNDSDVDLTMIEPCRPVYVDDDEDGQRIAWTDPWFRDMDGDGLGSGCDGDVLIAPGGMIEAEVGLHGLEDLDPGTYSFTMLFAATGDDAP